MQNITCLFAELYPLVTAIPPFFQVHGQFALVLVIEVLILVIEYFILLLLYIDL
jgi:hypothetical protein